MPGECSLPPPAGRLAAGLALEAGAASESWLNFPFSWGMWGKGRLDALELLDSRRNLPGERVARVCWAPEYVLSPIPSCFSFLTSSSSFCFWVSSYLVNT